LKMQGSAGNAEQLSLYVEVISEIFPVVPAFDECELRHLSSNEG